jgi:hypothetical protein
MSKRIGITVNGIKEECTVEAPLPCSRHTMHSDSKNTSDNFAGLQLATPEEVEAGLSASEYFSYNNSEPNQSQIIDQLNKIVDMQSKITEGWSNLIVKLQDDHDEGTKRLAASRNMTVSEYEKWLNLTDRTKGAWLQANVDDNDVISNAKWVSPQGDVVTIEADGDESGHGTVLTWFIGDKAFRKASVSKTFTSEDTDEIEELINKSFFK